MCAICRAARFGDHAGVIVVARRRLGLTQTGLGQRVGLSHSEVSRLETEPARSGTAAALRAGLARTRAEFDACRYALVGRRLPALVASGHQLLAVAASGQAREQAESALADVYSLAAFTADKTGEFGRGCWPTVPARTPPPAATLSASRRQHARPPSPCVGPVTTTRPRVC
ncbi:MAG TPA: helix-turn-helix transcriptional regulator [Pseudonocardiaceae bacterium]|jgi:transcriptional regulator with XRE-family HTH domain|nr:helix-turn-helix transcriptional regulator [Pseudonocardiaceae bacterium]